MHQMASGVHRTGRRSLLRPRCRSRALTSIKAVQPLRPRLAPVVFDRRQRRWLSAWLFVVLLFTQIATAAYACPQIVAGVPTASPAGAEFATPMADMPGCDGDMASAAMDPQQPQLCKAHCEPGWQTVNPASSASPSDLPTPALLAVLDWRPVTVAAPLSPNRRASLTPPGASPPGAPPLYLSLLVLRN